MSFAPVLAPGKRLGSLQLGATIGAVFKVLQEDSFTFRTVDVHYNPEVTSSSDDLWLDLVDHGVRLRFDAIAQRLRWIQVYDLRKLTIFYSSSPCCGPSVNPTFRSIYHTFGPTYPGSYDTDTQTYWLSYPGVAFAFPLASQFASIYTDTTTSAELPTTLPDGTEPIATQMRVMHGSDLHNPQLPPFDATSPYLQPVDIKIGKGASWGSGGCPITFTSTPQDVMSELGAPSAVHTKVSNKLRIHDAEADLSDGGCSDYFFNYPELGVDILFDAREHVVRKLIFHSNCPADPEFNSFSKSNFRLETSTGFITPETLWPEIVKMMGEPTRPVVHEGDMGGGGGGKEMPYGPSLYYGYPGVIFQVIKPGSLLSITLYQPLQHLHSNNSTPQLQPTRETS